MILLNATTKSLEVILTGAITSSQLDWSADYVDVTIATPAVTAADSSDGATNSTVAVTMVAAPGAGVRRQVNSLSVFNNDTVAQTVTIRINDNGIFRIRWKGSLDPGDTLQYQ